MYVVLLSSPKLDAGLRAVSVAHGTFTSAQEQQQRDQRRSKCHYGCKHFKTRCSAAQRFLRLWQLFRFPLTISHNCSNGVDVWVGYRPISGFFLLSSVCSWWAPFAWQRASGAKVQWVCVACIRTMSRWVICYGQGRGGSILDSPGESALAPPPQGRQTFPGVGPDWEPEPTNLGGVPAMGRHSTQGYLLQLLRSSLPKKPPFQRGRVPPQQGSFQCENHIEKKHRCALSGSHPQKQKKQHSPLTALHEKKKRIFFRGRIQN